MLPPIEATGDSLQKIDARQTWQRFMGHVSSDKLMTDAACETIRRIVVRVDIMVGCLPTQARTSPRPGESAMVVWRVHDEALVVTIDRFGEIEWTWSLELSLGYREVSGAGDSKSFERCLQGMRARRKMRLV